MTFSTMSTIIALIIAIAASADTLLGRAPKLYIAKAIARLAQDSDIGYFISSKIDKIFGSEIISYKSLKASVTISIFSICISYLLAYLTTPLSYVYIFPSNPEYFDIIIFILFVFGCILGDVLSYAQTRIFSRVIDSIKSEFIAITVGTADIAISLSIFIVINTVVRTLCYVLVLTLVMNVYAFDNESLTVEYIGSSSKYFVDNNNLQASDIKWIADMAKAASDGDSSRAIETYNKNHIPNEFAKFIKTYVIINCQDDFYKTDTGSENLYKLIYSNPLIASSPKNVVLKTSTFIDANQKIFNDFKNKNPRCPVKVITFQSKISAWDILRISGLPNAFWAAFDLTLTNISNNLKDKISNLVEIQPYQDLYFYVNNLLEEDTKSLFGVGVNDAGYSNLNSDFSPPIDLTATQRGVRIPFSTMLLSSLTVSVIFWFYILIIYISKVAQFITKYLQSPFPQ